MARYAYLVARLRSRQITMEEATELFGILQEALARAVAPGPEVRPEGEGARDRPAVSPPQVTGEMRPLLSDDAFGLSLIALGAGSGLLAALLKRNAAVPQRKRP